MIVFDSSTLILLARIELLRLFISDFRGKVVIPEAVRIELFRQQKEETPLLYRLINDKDIQVLSVKDNRQIDKIIRDFNIDRGEAEALTIALQERASLIATDDRNAIRACKLLNLDFTTAIAVLIRSFEKKIIDRNEALLKLQKLQSNGRYKRSIIEDARAMIL